MVKKWVYLLTGFLILIVISLIIVFIYTRGGYQGSADNAFPQVGFQYIYYDLFLWSSQGYSGYYNTITTPVSFIFGLFDETLLLLFGLKFGVIIEQWTFLSLGAIGIFLLLNKLIDKYTIYSFLSSFLGSIFFITSIGYSYSSVLYSIWPLPFFFLSYIYLIKDLKIGKAVKIDMFLMILFFSILLSSGPMSGVVTLFDYYLILLLIFILIGLFELNKKQFLKGLAGIIFVGFITLILISPLLLSDYLSFLNNSAAVPLISKTQELYSSSNNLFSSVVGFLSFQGIKESYTLNIVILLIILLSICFLLFYKLKSSLEYKFIFSIFITYLILISLSLIYSGTFYSITKSINITYDKFNIITLFGLGFNATAFIVFISVFLGFSIYSLSEIENKKLGYIILFFFIMLILIYTYFMDIIPSSTGFTFGGYPVFFGPKTIPKHVYSISKYINNIKGNFSIVTIPQIAFFEPVETWYYGVDIYSSMINKPIYIGRIGYLVGEETFTPDSSMEVYTFLNNDLENSNTSKLYFDNLLGIYGIRLLILQGDITKISTPFNPAPVFNISDIYYNLNRSTTFISKYANSSIYENKIYVPLVYAANGTFMKNFNLSKMFYIIGNKSFDIYDQAVFSNSIPGYMTAYYAAETKNETINATFVNITKFSKPDVTFEHVSPTRIIVHVKNATTPFYLIFRETYEPQWAAYYPNGTIVNSTHHIAANGFANAWYINKTGNYTITIYYTQQTYAWIAFAVSFAALFATIGLGVYGWIENKRGKSPKQKLHPHNKSGILDDYLHI